MRYFFQDQLRWNVGWETPNQGGAFVAMLLPWLWWLTLLAAVWGWRPGRRWPWAGRVLTAVLLVAEGVADWTLAKTYSRGALVALLAAGAFWVLLVAIRRRNARRVETDSARFGSDGTANLRRGATWLALRGVLLAGCVAASGFGSRLEPAYNAADRSVLNRLDLWQGGLQLVAASPWRGWGWGSSGAAFMQWAQPVGRTESYKSMVNSYLTVAVEGGLPLFAGALTVAMVVVLLGSRRAIAGAVAGSPDARPGRWRSRLGRVLVAASLPATASLVVWLAAMAFSNLWIIRGLWIVPAVAAFVILGGNLCGEISALPMNPKWLRGRWVRPLAVAVAFSVLLAALLLGSAKALASRSALLLGRRPDGTVILSKSGTRTDAPAVAVLPSPTVLGPMVGHELRRWALAAPAPLRLLVPSDLARLPAAPVPVTAFGEACVLPVLQGRRVVLVHPLAPPAGAFQPAAGSMVLLPGIDLARLGPRWQEWAGKAGVAVLSSGRVAVDLRSRWPEAVLELAW